MYTVYILYSANKDRYYIGHTKDITDRLKRHNEGRSKSTKTGLPWDLVYEMTYETKSEAYQEELAIKRQKSKKYIEKMIASIGG